MNFLQLCREKKESFYFWKTASEAHPGSEPVRRSPAQTDGWAGPTCNLPVICLVRIFL